MTPPTYTFLPGMHGDASLFPPLAEYFHDESVELVEYPQNISQDYKSLEKWLSEHLDWSQPRVLIAESFSGPLALQIAAKFPQSVKAIVLAASFCAAPTNPSLALLPLRPLMMLRPPCSTIRHFLCGDSLDDAKVKALQKTVINIPAKVLSQRVRTMLTLEAADCPSLPHIPMLILQAQYDNIISWDAQNQLSTHYEHATVHWLETPHLILQTAPAECHSFIREFLSNTLQTLTHV